MMEVRIIEKTGMEMDALLHLLNAWMEELPDDMDADDAFEALLGRMVAHFNADEDTEMDFAEFLNDMWEE